MRSETSISIDRITKQHDITHIQMTDITWHDKTHVIWYDMSHDTICYMIWYDMTYFQDTRLHHESFHYRIPSITYNRISASAGILNTRDDVCRWWHTACYEYVVPWRDYELHSLISFYDTLYIILNIIISYHDITYYDIISCHKILDSCSATTDYIMLCYNVSYHIIYSDSYHIISYHSYLGLCPSFSCHHQ